MKRYARRLDRSITTALLGVVMSILIAISAWLGFLTLCLYDRGIRVCGTANADLIILLGTLAFSTGWIAWHTSARLRKRLRRGEWRYNGPYPDVPGTALLENVQRLIFDDGEPRKVDTLVLYDKTGWWVSVPMENGTRAWVGRQDFYEWFIQVVKLHNDADFGKSAIGRGQWEPAIGRVQWWARVWLLMQVGAVMQNTSDPRSRRLARTDIHRIMEDLEDRLGLVGL